MPGEFQKKLGRRLAELRKRAGFTQARLAERMDLSTETISRTERGATVPGVETLAEIAKVLGCEPYEMLKFPKKASSKKTLIEEITHMLRQFNVGDLSLAKDLVEVVRRLRTGPR